ncbi:regulatory protein, luxR family [Rhizobiales bacterium GAS113]|nr:regulatory protein, luxR family [Rhizobiales bacterium GAS113]
MAGIDTTETAKLPRIAFVTIGQAPRTDVVPEILGMLDRLPVYEEFGALDGLSYGEIARQAAGPEDDTLYTRLADGRHVVLRADFVEERLQALMRRVDQLGYDLVVLITTGVFRPISMRTPFVHGQRALEAWISTLVLGDCQLGVIYPLAQQARTAPFYGTSIQNARSAAAAGGTRSLQEAAKRLESAELILMLSFGHTEAMARRVALIARKPVVTTRRIVAGMMRLHLGALGGADGLGAPTAGAMGGRDLIGRLPPPLHRLTRREEDVLAHVLDGRSNKLIGRALGISHRTVEIHRSRAMAKFGTSSTTELIRWTLMSRGG